jgi:hypothetical protein
MKNYTFTTHIPPLSDDDLKWNYEKYRRKYWIREGLLFPEDITVIFGKMHKGKSRKEDFCAIAQSNDKIIILDPILKHVWDKAVLCLLHEMAHIYTGSSTNWDLRKRGHGKTFQNEINRLYALGAFRELI